MTRERYETLVLEIKSDLPKIPTFPEAMDLARQILEDDLEMRQCLKNTTDGVLERLAADLI